MKLALIALLLPSALAAVKKTAANAKETAFLEELLERCYRAEVRCGRVVVSRRAYGPTDSVIAFLLLIGRRL